MSDTPLPANADSNISVATRDSFGVRITDEMVEVLAPMCSTTRSTDGLTKKGPFYIIITNPSDKNAVEKDLAPLFKTIARHGLGMISPHDRFTMLPPMVIDGYKEMVRADPDFEKHVAAHRQAVGESRSGIAPPPDKRTNAQNALTGDIIRTASLYYDSAQDQEKDAHWRAGAGYDYVTYAARQQCFAVFDAEDKSEYTQLADADKVAGMKFIYFNFPYHDRDKYPQQRRYVVHYYC